MEHDANDVHGSQGPGTVVCSIWVAATACFLIWHLAGSDKPETLDLLLHAVFEDRRRRRA